MKIIFIIIISLSSAFANKIKKGDKAPNIIAVNLSGGLFNLSQNLSSRYTIVSFGSTYCTPCLAEIKRFQSLKEQIKSKELKIILIFIDENIEDIKSYISKHQIKLPIYHDNFGVGQKRYQVVALPSTFILNRKRRVIYRFRGFKKSTMKKIKRLLK